MLRFIVYLYNYLSSHRSTTDNKLITRYFSVGSCTGFEEEYLLQKNRPSYSNTEISISSKLWAFEIENKVVLLSLSTVKNLDYIFQNSGLIISKNSIFELEKIKYTVNSNAIFYDSLIFKNLIILFFKNFNFSLISKIKFLLYFELSPIFGWSGLLCLLMALKVNYKIIGVKPEANLVFLDNIVIFAWQLIYCKVYGHSFCIIPSFRTSCNDFNSLNPGYFYLPGFDKYSKSTYFVNKLKALNSISVIFSYNFFFFTNKYKDSDKMKKRENIEIRDLVPTFFHYLFEIFMIRTEEFDVESAWEESPSMNRGIFSGITIHILLYNFFSSIVSILLFCIFVFLEIFLFFCFTCFSLVSLLFVLTAGLLTLALFYFFYINFVVGLESENSTMFSELYSNISTSGSDTINQEEYLYILDSPLNYTGSVRRPVFNNTFVNFCPEVVSENSLRFTWWSGGYNFNTFPGFSSNRLCSVNFFFDSNQLIDYYQVSFSKTYHFNNSSSNKFFLNSNDILMNPRRADCLNGLFPDFGWGKFHEIHYDVGLLEAHRSVLPEDICNKLEDFHNQNLLIDQIGLLKGEKECLVSSLNSPKLTLVEGLKYDDIKFVNSNIYSSLESRDPNFHTFINKSINDDIKFIVDRIETGGISIYEVIE